MASYLSTAKKFSTSEQRLFALLDELDQVRRECRAGAYRDKELCARGEALFDAADTERQIAQMLFDDLTAQHRAHWERELQRQKDAARAALVPLVRAWRIAHRAFGASGCCPVWVQGQVSGAFLDEIQTQVSQETTEMPLDPPKSFALIRADDELRS